MITLAAYEGKKLGVFGLGKAGQATVASLLAGGAEVFAWDDSEASRTTSLAAGPHPTPLPQAGEGSEAKPKRVRVSLLPPSQWPWKELTCLVLSPGVPLTHPHPHAVVALAKQAGCPILGDIELLYRACPEATYIGITGTNGKSTTTTLLGHILHECGRRAEVGGNLGMPALTLAPLGEAGVYVLELSSYQLDLIHEARFAISVLLNITPDHLDRHGDMAGYIAAKRRIFMNQQPQDIAVIAVDDAHTQEIAQSLEGKMRVILVSASRVPGQGVYVKDGVLHDAPHRFDISDIVTLTGRHNWQNAAAAYAAARACGLAPEAIVHAMRSFPGLKHRLELVAEIRGVRFINDSKATNAEAAAVALDPYDHIYWIAGGKPKSGGIESLAPYFPKIAHAFLIGEAEGEFAQTLEGKISYTRCGALDRAVQAAASLAWKEKKPGAVVLLSPACASFDQFKNFEERGEAFCVLVRAMSDDAMGDERGQQAEPALSALHREGSSPSGKQQNSNSLPLTPRATAS